MSFIENNKTWILPLLGLGAAGVIWMNVRAFNPPPPAAQEPLPSVESTPSPLAVADAPSTSGINESLWDDLRPVAFVPTSLEAHATFEQKALHSLPPEAFSTPGAPSVARPSGSEPSRSSRTMPGSPGPGTPGTAPQVAPSPDFLIDGPGGPQAWFDGRGYRIGQPLKGRPFSVRGIRLLPTPKATLQTTQGAMPEPKTKPAPEVP